MSTQNTSILRAALEEIAKRGPVAGLSEIELGIRLVVTQSIARDALAASENCTPSVAPKGVAEAQESVPAHTPGQWNLGFGNYVYKGSDPYSNRRLIAICEPTTKTREDWKETFANARLIAQAPAMLAALEAAEKWAMLTQTDPVPWLDDASTILAGVKGGGK